MFYVLYTCLSFRIGVIQFPLIFIAMPSQIDRNAEDLMSLNLCIHI